MTKEINCKKCSYWKKDYCSYFDDDAPTTTVCSVYDKQVLKAALEENKALKAELEEKDNELNDALFYNRDVLEAKLADKEALLDRERLRGILNQFKSDLLTLVQEKYRVVILLDRPTIDCFKDKAIAAIRKESE